jgi:S-methylmethionine-dependent homocysteine/selenocysteine methylase
MSAKAAEDYHRQQVQALRTSNADMVTATTMTYPDEAIGIANAGAAAGVPVVISFTVETDGRLPIDISLKEAIEQVDQEAEVPPAYYMINCAHPDHFNLVEGAPWLGRIGGVRANASRMSHAELDESETLDDGDPEEFGEQHRWLRDALPDLRVIGGCCGTDHRHVAAVAGTQNPGLAANLPKASGELTP